MAFALLLDARLVYYDEGIPAFEMLADNAKTSMITENCPHNDRQKLNLEETIRDLLVKDARQVSRPTAELLQHCECFRAADKAFIYERFRRNFEDTDDMVNTIKAFIKTRMHTSLLQAPALVEDQARSFHRTETKHDHKTTETWARSVWARLRDMEFHIGAGRNSQKQGALEVPLLGYSSSKTTQ
jgi:hypothetical protein